ncbi:glycoside hydrolase family 16 protein [Flavobacterium sp. SOK18b]|uniref:family 16 glycosylhydrolase n=1 Tax=Flavobacterium sp. SOK18b TaxID=797900 RepID=UPI0015FAB852|nr:family 16 glycosylhydrolase [Flavobacterium sp. SOK18b]MBB1193409.1 glycoside hydrolase family 16 protein [Flavobacterium sp. SOK18b]
MKKILIKIVSVFILLLMVNCQEDNLGFGAIEAPSNLKVTAEIIGKSAAFPNGDGSGKVKFVSTAENAISYKYVFSDGTSKNQPSGILEYPFATPGTNTYTVTIIASGAGGVTSSTTIEVTVFSNFKDEAAVQFLTGGSSKKWYWAQSEPEHLGVGPNVAWSDPTFGTQNYYPSFYRAAANEKAATCLYKSVMTFSLVGQQMKFELDNKGQTYYNAALKGVNEDACFDLVTTGSKLVSLSKSESFVSKNPGAATQTRGTVLNIADGGFMGYFVGSSSYEILSLTDNRMRVRVIQAGNPFLAWYHTFTTTPPAGAVTPPSANYNVLKFSDEFNTDGAPDPTKWGYDLGAGGWGNNESQSYTSASDNVVVAGGNLKITAKKVGSGYTSARLKSENKFEFTYGRVEVRAKLTTGAGTWPAIWMLGENYATNAWPACGEIDIMEFKGSQPTTIYGTLHYPGNSGGNGNGSSTTIANAASEFHIYKTIWSPESVKIYVDDVLFHTVANTSALPFNKDFFLILNVAMGGTFGGAIDPAFSQSSMEIDYVRVYQ